MGANDLLFLSGNALRAYQGRITVASQNIANVETEGYSRRTQEISTATDGRGYAIGVEVGDVTRCYNAVSAAALLQEESTLSYHSETVELLSELEVYSGGDEGGLASALSDFETAWQDVATNPEDAAARTVLLQKSAALAAHFNQLSGHYSNFSNMLAADGTGQINQSVEEINTLTEQLQDLNRNISHADYVGRSIPALRDERDRLVGELAKLADVSVSPNYQVSLGGQELLASDGSARQTLDYTAPQTFSVGGTDISSLIAGGTMAAQVGAYTTAQGMQERLDLLAQSLMSEVNTLFDSGYNLNGASPAEEGYTFFTGTDASDIALDTTLFDPSNPLSGNPSLIAAAATRASAGPPPIPNSGDNTIANEIGGLLNADLGVLDDRSFAEYWSDSEILLAGVVSEAKQLEQTSTALVGALNERVQSQAGVNLDEELMDLLNAQRSYEACSRIFSTASKMLDTLLNLI